MVCGVCNEQVEMADVVQADGDSIPAVAGGKAYTCMCCGFLGAVLPEAKTLPQAAQSGDAPHERQDAVLASLQLYETVGFLLFLLDRCIYVSSTGRIA